MFKRTLLRQLFLSHLIVLTALGIIEFLIRIPRVLRQKTTTESKGLELNDGRQREGMKATESSMLIEEFGHD